MEGPTNVWKLFDERTPILTCEYSFGPGRANSLAVGGDHRLPVVAGQPSRRVGDPVRARLHPRTLDT